MGNDGKAPAKVISVTARPWKHGWDLEFGDDHATSVRYLKDAPQQVIDYLDTFEPDIDHSGIAVEVTPDLGELQMEIREAKLASLEAARMQVVAGERIRALANSLKSSGMSTSDIAAVLEVSRSRVYQMLAKAS